MQQGKGKVKVKTKLMLKIGIHHTFFVRKLKELEEKVSSDQRGNTWQNTKGNEFSVPKKYVLKKKKKLQIKHRVQGDMGGRTQHFLPSILSTQIIYCLPKIQITLNKGFPYLVCSKDISEYASRHRINLLLLTAKKTCASVGGLFQYE